MATPERVEVSVLLKGDGLTTAVPVAIAYDQDAGCGRLLDKLASLMDVAPDSLSLYVVRSGTRVEGDKPISVLELRDGDVLSSVRAARPSHIERGTWQLLLEGGPGVGAVWELRDQPVIIGRGSEATVRVPDASVSGAHAMLQVKEGRVWISDLGSTNGTAIDGRTVGSEPVVFDAGAVARLGGSLFSVCQVREPTLVAQRYESGRLLVNRPPRTLTPTDPPVISLPAPPKPPTKARLPILTALVPLLLGIVIAEVMHNAMFLMFSLLSPVMAVISVVSDRRSGKSAYKKAVQRFSGQVERVRSAAAEAQGSDLRVQRTMAPGPGEVARRALGLEQSLWERRPADRDFLALRVGMADLPARLRFEGANQDDSESPPGPLDEICEEHATDPLVPVVVPLGDGVLGIVGPRQDGESIGRSMVIAAACLHSPRDLAIVALLPTGSEASWNFLGWLPHLGLLVQSGRTAGTSTEECRYLLGIVDEIVLQRQRSEHAALASREPRSLPRVLLIVVGDVDVSRPVLSRVLENGPAVGVTSIIISETVQSLPGECTHIASLSSLAESAGELSLVEVRSGAKIADIVGDLTSAELMEAVALALAPLRDTTAGGGGAELPRRVSLLDLLDLADPTPDAIEARWARSRVGLAGVMGVGPDGPESIDLQTEGPHMLVGGTTGAGKSELLQTFVAALAASHPPTRLTFVLIDYKGGAAFKQCVELPHVTGSFTDLDGHLAHRALESLEAEVRRREHLLASAGYKNLVDFEKGDPEHAPPSLLIIFDEFATLKASVPEFVDGVVDIAARGRSLGVHLVLATQRPAGSIDDKIRANVPVRMSLRFHDDQESIDILTVPDAARIPDGLVGRAFIRSGSDIHPVQVAYAGGRRPDVRGEPVVVAQAFSFGPFPGSLPPPDEGRSGATDLERLVAAITGAWTRMGRDKPRRPWLEPLREKYSLEDLVASARDAVADDHLATVAGVVDRPERQSQDPLVLDLDELGHLLVFGTGGSGKTTLLRTIGAGLAERWSASDLHLYCLDFATRGLHALGDLPQCGGTASASDVERTERILGTLEKMIGERQVALGNAGAGSFIELRGTQAEGRRSPWVVLLLDGYGGFADVFGTIDAGAQVDRLAQIVADGPSVGVHVVISVDRRGAVPNRLMASMPGRVVLRMGDADEYQWLGLRNVGDATLPPGRGFISSGSEIHVAVLGEDASGAAQAEAIRKLGARLCERTAERAPRIGVLGDDVSLGSLPDPIAGSLRVPLGVDGASLEPVLVHLDEAPTFLICGPDGSGRSVALGTLFDGLRTSDPDAEMALLAPRRTPLSDRDEWSFVARGLDDVTKLAERLATPALTEESSTGRLVIIVDDGEELLEGAVADHLERIVRRTRDGMVVVCAACQTHRAHRAYGGWLSEMRKAKHGLVITPDVDVDGDLFGVRFPRRSALQFPPGRGYLAGRAGVTLIQVAR